MFYLPQLALLMGVWAIAVISPGPDFVATVHLAVSRSRREGILAGLGVTSGIALWIIASMAGLSVLFAQVSWLVNLFRLLGALYLLYLGVRTLWSAYRPHPSEKMQGSEPQPDKRGSSWRIGFLTNVGNPKALAFFGSIFAILLPAHPPLWFQCVCVLLMLGMAAAWFSAVACLFSFGPVARGYQRLKRWLDLLTGGLFVALGLRLALSR